MEECFNKTWYNAYESKVLLLEEAKEDGPDVLKVTGSDNKLEIAYQGKVLENADCNPNNNKWIIVKVTTLSKDWKGVWNSYIFYVDDITSIADEERYYGVFENIWCYSIEIIAANTSAVECMMGMFLNVKSALEQDLDENTPGLIGLDKLNVENVGYINVMFGLAIRKQATLVQLENWRFSGKNKVFIDLLFYSQVEGLNFRVLDGWSSSTYNGTVSFMLTNNSTSAQVFVQNGNENDFEHPSWYNDIEETK